MSFYKFLVPKIELNISIVHTYEEEISEIIGVNSDEYLESTAICYFSETDINELGIKEGTNVKVSTKWGSVVLKALKSPYTTKGTAFIPRGISACQIIPSDLKEDGSLKLKNFQGFVESTDEKIKTYKEILELYKK